MRIAGGATAYGIPVALRLIVARGDFEPGPISLGRLSWPVNVLGLLYIVLICAAAVMPTTYPITKDTLNYTPITWGGVILTALAFW